MKVLLLCGGMLGVAGLVAWGSGFAVLLATQICVLWCFGLSYQLLFGRTGMLSFGHAVAFGLAAFATTHAVRWLGGTGGWPIYEVLPLFGALAGMLCGLVLGYPVTRRSGVAFAMVTLGLGELVAACFLMFPGFFGGEAGVTLQRTTVASALGLDYGRSANQLLLTSCWSLLVVGVILWLAQTPFGLAIVAVRENPQRIEFLGYRTASVRWAWPGLLARCRP
jgi:branched-chain amino acid transport system permease protein